MAEQRIQIQIASDISGAEKGIKTVSRSMADLNSQAKEMVSPMNALKGAIGALGIGYMIKDVLDAALQMESLTRQFTVFTGSAALAAKELQFVRDQANRLGLDAIALTSSYALFLNAVKGTANEGQKARNAFVGISEGMAAIGMTADMQSRAWAQLNQGIMKGKFELEDLKTINEAGLPIFKLMADALGITTGEFMKQQKEGKILANDVLPLLGESMHQAYGVAALEGAKSAQGQINLMNNAMRESKAVAGEALMPTFTSLITNVFTPLVKLIGLAVKGLQDMAAAAAFTANQLMDGIGGFFTGKMFTKTGYKELMEKSLENERIYKEQRDKIWSGPTSSDYSAADKAKTEAAAAAAAKTAAQIATAKSLAAQWRTTYADIRTEIENTNPLIDKHAQAINKVNNRFEDLAHKKGADKALLAALRTELVNNMNARKAEADAVTAAADANKAYWDNVDANWNGSGKKTFDEIEQAIRRAFSLGKGGGETATLALERDLAAIRVAFEQTGTSAAQMAEQIQGAIDKATGTTLPGLNSDNAALETALIEDPYEKQRKSMEDYYKAEKDAIDEKLKLLKATDATHVALTKKRALVEKNEIKDLTEVDKESYRSRLSVASMYTGMAGDLFSALASTQDQSSRKGFETAKAFNIAAATMSTAAAIMNAMATVPYPASIAMAALAAATGAIQIAKIAATSFGGGGTVAGVPSGAFGASGDTAGVGTKIGAALVTGQSAYGEGDALQLLAESAISASLAIGDLVGAFESVSKSFTTDSAVVSMFRNGSRIVTESNDRVLQIVNAEMEKSYNIAINAAAALGTNVTSGLTNLIAYKRGSKDDKPEAAAAFLNKVVTDAQDLYAKSVTGLIDFTDVGERAWDALQRLSGSLYTANDGFERIGATLLVGLSGANMASKISVALGGDDEMQSVINDYFEGMFTEAEQDAAKAQQASRQVTEQFHVLGISGIGTNQQFKDLVDSIDKTKDSGATLFVELMKIAPAFAEMTKYAEELAAASRDMNMELLSLKGLEDSADYLKLLNEQREAEIALLDPSLQGIKRQINAQIDLNAATKAATEATKAATEARETATEARETAVSEATTALRKSIDAEIKSLQDRANITAKAYATAATVLDVSYAAQRTIIVEGQTTVLDALKTGLEEATKAADELQTTFDMLKSAREGMQLSNVDSATMAAAQADLASILTSARNGDTSRIAGMADTAQIVSGISAESYTNSADYQRAFWQTSNSLLELENITGKQLTDAQQQVETLNTLIETTTKSNEATLSAFDAELNAIKGISINVLPLAEARRQYEATKAANDIAQSELMTQTTWLNAQYDMLTNVNTSVLSVQAAMNNLAGLLGKPAPSAVAPSSPMAAYAGTDSPALRDAKVQAQNNISYDSSDTGLLAAAKALYASTHGGANTAYYNAAASSVGGDIGAALGWNGSMEDTERLRDLYGFAVGTNYVPYDMTANIHEGERIIPKADNYKFGQDSEALVAEIKGLRAELRIQNGESAKWNQKTAKILDKWDGDGMPAVAA